MGVHQTHKVYSQIKELLEIPNDEPIIVFRAQDKFAVSVLLEYRKIVNHGTMNAEKPEGWKENLDMTLIEFVDWQRNNKDKLKVPD